MKRAFGAIPRGRAPAAAEVAPARPARVAVTSGAGSPPEIVLGFRTANLPVKDIAALDLLAAVLARGDGARLQRELVRNRQLADGVRPFSYRARDVGLVAFAVTPAPAGSPRRRRRRWTSCCGPRWSRPPPTSSRRRAPPWRATSVGRGGGARAARRLGFAMAITGDADDARHYRDAIRSVGPTELRAIATRS